MSQSLSFFLPFVIVLLLIRSSAAEPYRIGVWYLTEFNSAMLNTGTPSSLTKQARSVLGRSDKLAYWGSLAASTPQHAESQIAISADNNLENRRPLIGFYDLMDQTVVNKEIREAASEGIDFFAFYWYIDADTGVDTRTEKSAPIAKFFNSPDAHLMQFVLAPIVVQKKGTPYTLSIWKEKTVPEIISYMKSPYWLRINGHPVLINFSVHFANNSPPSDYREAHEFLEASIEASIGITPIEVVVLGPQADYRNITWRSSALGDADAFTCFSFGPSLNEEPYDVFSSLFIHDMKKQISYLNSHIPYIPCGSTGQDRRLWDELWKGTTLYQTSMARLHWTIKPTSQQFRNHLQEIKAIIDKNPNNTFHAAILYSWNEWGEGAAQIEPSQNDKYSYADQIRDVFNLKPRSGRP
jgi:hypothetical protein